MVNFLKAMFASPVIMNNVEPVNQIKILVLLLVIPVVKPATLPATVLPVKKDFSLTLTYVLPVTTQYVLYAQDLLPHVPETVIPSAKPVIPPEYA